jgi:hypothetical protein
MLGRPILECWASPFRFLPTCQTRTFLLVARFIEKPIPATTTAGLSQNRPPFT